MTQTIESLNEIESHLGTTPVCGEIIRGDRTSRYKFVGNDGNSSLALADDVYSRYHLAESLNRLMEDNFKRRQRLNEEAGRLFQIVEKWREENKDKIDWHKTKISEEILVSSSGRIRFQFIVIPQGGQADFLEDKLVLLDQSIFTNPSFKIVRLVSLLM